MEKNSINLPIEKLEQWFTKANKFIIKEAVLHTTSRQRIEKKDDAVAANLNK